MRRGGLLLVLILVPALMALNHRRDAHRAIASFEWSVVKKGPLRETVGGRGNLRAHRIEALKSSLTGSVKKKHVRLGDVVKKGQVLLEIKSAGGEINLGRQANLYKSARYKVRKAKKDLRVQKGLFRKHAVPRDNIEKAQRILDEATQAFTVVSMTYAREKKRMAGARVTAPIAGTVLEDHLKGRRGVKVEQPLFLIGDTQSFKVEVLVDELDIPKLRVGLPATIRVDAFPESPIRGRVSQIAPKADGESFAQIRVTLEVFPSVALRSRLKDNLSAEADLIIGEIKDILSIPAAAVRKKHGREYVAIRKKKSGKTAWRSVKIGRRAQRSVEVLSGVSVGEYIGAPND
jgi:HlyD family secretion protein